MSSKPIIGVPLRYDTLEDGRAIVFLGERIRRTLQKAGAIVFPIAPVQDVDYIYTKGNEFLELTEEEKRIINHNLDMCDALFFPGGMKIAPYDRYVLECAIERKMPVLGVCLGMQMMSCYDEDIKLVKNDTGFNHYQKSDDILTHKVKIDKNSLLYKIIGKDEIMVNSFHNYHAIENHIFKTVATSEDGLIEAIEYPGDFFNLGIQWHPEISYDFDDNSKKIINYFLKMAEEYINKK